MKKMADFYSYERTESAECTEEISQEASCSSHAPDRETSSDGPCHPPPAFCSPNTKMGSRERPCQSSWLQKSPWLH